MSIKKGILSFVCFLIITAILAACNSQPTSEPTSQSVARPMPTGKGVTWKLVVIGDSSLWGLGKAMAMQIEKDQGVKVELYDATPGGLSVGNVRKALEKGDSTYLSLTKLNDELKTAQYVIMFANPMDSMLPDKPIEFDACFFAEKPGDCGLDRFVNYISDLEFIWKKIIELRAGQPTILRAVDIYNPLVGSWIKNGVFNECTACWANMSTAARQAAGNLGIPFLSRFDAFNGRNHQEDPRQKGYILADGEHPTDLANEHTAKLLSAMGYMATN
jgi:hypothetical protein